MLQSELGGGRAQIQCGDGDLEQRHQQCRPTRVMHAVCSL